MAELEGRLDCATLELSAEAASGMYGIGLPIGLPIGAFGGTLSGALDRDTLALSGEWSLADVNGAVGCKGPWTATFMP